MIPAVEEADAGPKFKADMARLQTEFKASLGILLDLNSEYKMKTRAVSVAQSVA